MTQKTKTPLGIPATWTWTNDVGAPSPPIATRAQVKSKNGSFMEALWLREGGFSLTLRGLRGRGRGEGMEPLGWVCWAVSVSASAIAALGSALAVLPRE